MERSFRKLLDAFEDQFETQGRTPGQVVRDQRKKQGWTLDNLSEITGIKASNLSSIENDKIVMTSHYADIFGAAFGIPAFFFLYPNGEAPKSKELEAIERRALKFSSRRLVKSKSKKPRAAG